MVHSQVLRHADGSLDHLTLFSHANRSRSVDIVASSHCLGILSQSKSVEAITCLVASVQFQKEEQERLESKCTQRAFCISTELLFKMNSRKMKEQKIEIQSFK